jgi:hypothetical protein
MKRLYESKQTNIRDAWESSGRDINEKFTWVCPDNTQIKYRFDRIFYRSDFLNTTAFKLIGTDMIDSIGATPSDHYGIYSRFNLSEKFTSISNTSMNIPTPYSTTSSTVENHRSTTNTINSSVNVDVLHLKRKSHDDSTTSTEDTNKESKRSKMLAAAMKRMEPDDKKDVVKVKELVKESEVIDLT